MEIPIGEIASLGVGGVLGIIIFIMYRRDRKGSEKKCDDYADQLRQDRVFMEDRLSGIINKDQETREKHTTVLEKLVTTLNRMNGRTKQ